MWFDSGSSAFELIVDEGAFEKLAAPGAERETFEAEVAADPEWLLVLSWLESAGSPLEIMDELDACAKRWEARWCDGDLPEDQEQELQRRWQTFRRYPQET